MAVPEPDSVSLPARIGGKYRPVRLLGRGGMGAVYEVEHENTGQRMALKVIGTHMGLTLGALARFRTEARTTGQIRSDHVVSITDADVAPELGGLPFLVMELLVGADLQRVTRDAPATPADVVEWLRQVARGLARAHALGVVHRDLKPENLFLTRRDDGTSLVKILDFGVAKVLQEGTAETSPDQIVGTPLYMAPEQATSSHRAITFRTDGFALGLVAFRLLVGRSYWRPGTVVQLVSQATLEPMPPASERGATFGPGFDGWFAKACARDPDARFDGPQEQIEALAEVFGMERVAVVAPSLPPAPLPRSRTPLETAQTLAASGNVAISRAGSRSERSVRRGRVAPAVVVAMGALLVGGLAVGAAGLRRDAVIVAGDAARGSAAVSASAEPTLSSSESSPRVTAPPTPGPSSVERVAAEGGAPAAAPSGPAPVSPAIRRSTPRPPASAHRDPLEDQN